MDGLDGVLSFKSKTEKNESPPTGVNEPSRYLCYCDQKVQYMIN